MKSLNFSLLVLFSFVAMQAYGQRTIFNTSITSLKCETDGTSKEYQRGEKANLCVHFVNEYNSSLNMRIIYNVIVDDYAALTIEGVPYNSGNTALAVQADTTNSTSSGIYFIKKNGTANQVYTVFSAVIELKNGIIQSVLWDNGCFSCDIGGCDDKYNATDGITYRNCFDPNCGSAGSSNTTCDPKIYVSWIGTDKNGLKMESAGYRISSFRSYSIAELWASAKTLLQAAYDPIAKSYCSIAGNCVPINSSNETNGTSDTNGTNETNTTNTTPAIL